MRFSPEVVHVEGNHQITADMLSRAPASKPSPAETFFVEEVQEYAAQALKILPVTEARLKE